MKFDLFDALRCTAVDTLIGMLRTDRNTQFSDVYIHMFTYVTGLKYQYLNIT